MKRTNEKFYDQPLWKRLLIHTLSGFLLLLTLSLAAVPIALAIILRNPFYVVYLLGSAAILWGLIRVLEARLPEWVFNR